MVKADLVAALDFGKKKGVPHEQYSYRRDDLWYVVKCGPGYSNTYKVTEYDDDGLAFLAMIERPDESTGQG